MEGKLLSIAHFILTGIDVACSRLAEPEANDRVAIYVSETKIELVCAAFPENITIGLLKGNAVRTTYTRED